MDLDLYVGDNSIESPYLSRNFKDEVIFELYYLKLNEFLDEDEIKVLSPNAYGKITLGEKKPLKTRDQLRLLGKLAKVISGKESMEKADKLFDEFLITSEKLEDRERDPLRLKTVLQKVQEYLIEKSAEFPLVHLVYASEKREVKLDHVMIDGVKGHLEGDLCYYDNYQEVRTKIHVKSYFDDYGKLDFFVEAKPEIRINDLPYFTKTITKAEQFAAEFAASYAFLERAIQANKRVLWEYG